MQTYALVISTVLFGTISNFFFYCVQNFVESYKVLKNLKATCLFVPKVDPEKVTIPKFGRPICAGKVAFYVLHAHVATYLPGWIFFSLSKVATRRLD